MFSACFPWCYWCSFGCQKVTQTPKGGLKQKIGYICLSPSCTGFLKYAHIFSTVLGEEGTWNCRRCEACYPQLWWTSKLLPLFAMHLWELFTFTQSIDEDMWSFQYAPPMGALCRLLTLFLKFKLLITGFMHDLQKSPVCHLLSCLILCLHSASRLETERGKLALRMALPGMFLNLL